MARLDQKDIKKYNVISWLIFYASKKDKNNIE